jgi:hypothetical protein
MVASLVDQRVPTASERHRTLRPRWVHRASVDVAVALCWVPFVLGAHAVEANPAVLTSVVTGVFLLSFAHQPLTLALVYGDPEQFRLRRLIFTLSPLVFAAAIVVLLHVSLITLAIVAGLWNAEHTLMQRYGITRIYGRKADQQNGGLERAMLLSWLALAFVWVAADRATSHRLEQAGLNGTNEMAVRVLLRFHSAAQFLIGPMVVLVAALVATWIVAEARRRGDANPAKWLYVATTAALFVVILIDPIAGLMGYVGAHAIEYFVIVHQSLGRRYGDEPDPASARPVPLARAIRARTGRIGFFVAYLGAVVGLVTLLGWYGSRPVYLVVFFTLGGLHVFYDGFIWKLRRPAVARSLALPGQGPA